MTHVQPVDTTDTPFISEPLTWEQICERYPNEWVCLVEIDEVNDTDFDFRTARVVGHGRTRGEPLIQADPYIEIYRDFGHYFTGDWRTQRKDLK